MSNDTTRIWLLLGRFHGDKTPVVIGAIDRSVWEHWDDEDEQEWLKRTKDSFGCDPTDLEWREVWGEFDSYALEKAFERPVLRGVVE